jgi:hypothetical protein
MQTFFFQPVAQTVVLWKSGKIVSAKGCLPIWVLIFGFPKWVSNNIQLGIILFQTQHLSQDLEDKI